MEHIPCAEQECSTNMQAMRDIVAKCLVKDPTKRPTAAQLLEHKFLKTAHEPTYLVKHLLAGLPPVTERVRLMRTGKGGVPSLQQNQHMAAQSQATFLPSAECLVLNSRPATNTAQSELSGQSTVFMHGKQET